MHSPESLRQLTRLHSLGSLREQRSHIALARTQARSDACLQRLNENREQLDALESERLALFGQHRGVMTAVDLFRLRRWESVLESRRIELMLARGELLRNHEEAQSAVLHARVAIKEAQRRRNKLTYVAGLFRRDVRLRVQISEDLEIEEHRYDH